MSTQIFFEKIACAETAELRMMVSYTTNMSSVNGSAMTYICMQGTEGSSKIKTDKKHAVCGVLDIGPGGKR